MCPRFKFHKGSSSCTYKVKSAFKHFYLHSRYFLPYVFHSSSFSIVSILWSFLKILEHKFGSWQKWNFISFQNFSHSKFQVIQSLYLDLVRSFMRFLVWLLNTWLPLIRTCSRAFYPSPIPLSLYIPVLRIPCSVHMFHLVTIPQATCLDSYLRHLTHPVLFLKQMNLHHWHLSIQVVLPGATP